MFAEFSSIYYFLKYCDENGSLKWSKTSQKLAFLYYLNDENLDLEDMISQLNEFRLSVRWPPTSFNLKEKFFCDEAFQSRSVQLWLCKKSCICSLWISFFLSLFSLSKPSLWKKRNLNKLTEDLWVSKTCGYLLVLSANNQLVIWTFFSWANSMRNCSLREWIWDYRRIYGRNNL